MNTYTCTECGQEFKKGWSDEEAEAEAQNRFSPEELQDAVVVCEDCYRQIMGEA